MAGWKKLQAVKFSMLATLISCQQSSTVLPFSIFTPLVSPVAAKWCSAIWGLIVITDSAWHTALPVAWKRRWCKVFLQRLLRLNVWWLFVPVVRNNDTHSIYVIYHSIAKYTYHYEESCVTVGHRWVQVAPQLLEYQNRMTHATNRCWWWKNIVVANPTFPSSLWDLLII